MNSFGTSPLELMACDAMLQGLVYLDEFTYSAVWAAGTPTALGALATVDVPIQINSDSDFIVQEQNLSAIVVTPDSPDDIHECVDCPDLLITLIKAGSGREVMNQAQHVTNIFGNYWAAQFPGRKSIAALWQANNTITCRLQNRTATAFDRVEISFLGFKVFYQTNNQGASGDRRTIFHAF
jgi:hypothetical protein